MLGGSSAVGRVAVGFRKVFTVTEGSGFAAIFWDRLLAGHPLIAAAQQAHSVIWGEDPEKGFSFANVVNIVGDAYAKLRGAYRGVYSAASLEWVLVFEDA